MWKCNWLRLGRAALVQAVAGLQGACARGLLLSLQMRVLSSGEELTLSTALRRSCCMCDLLDTWINLTNVNLVGAGSELPGRQEEGGGRGRGGGAAERGPGGRGADLPHRAPLARRAPRHCALHVRYAGAPPGDFVWCTRACYCACATPPRPSCWSCRCPLRGACLACACSCAVHATARCIRHPAACSFCRAVTWRTARHAVGNRV